MSGHFVGRIKGDKWGRKELDMTELLNNDNKSVPVLQFGIQTKNKKGYIYNNGNSSK